MTLEKVSNRSKKVQLEASLWLLCAASPLRKWSRPNPISETWRWDLKSRFSQVKNNNTFCYHMGSLNKNKTIYNLIHTFFAIIWGSSFETGSKHSFRGTTMRVSDFPFSSLGCQQKECHFRGFQVDADDFYFWICQKIFTRKKVRTFWNIIFQPKSIKIDPENQDLWG